MSGTRFRTVFVTDFRQTLKRPLFLVLILILGFTAMGLAGGHLRIASGDASVGGTKAWLTSEFAQAQMLSMVVFIFYMFFITIGSGTVVMSDEDWKVQEMLRSTRLNTGEYVWAKFLAVLAGFFLVLAIHLLFTVFFNHILPTPNAEEIRGPFVVLNYVRPAIMFGAPALVLFGGVAFAVGALTRKPVLVFLFPIALLMFCVFFLWDWSPSWLDPRINKILQWVEPSGFRWLNETWLKVDQGVEYYNQQPITYDASYLLSRLGFVSAGLGAVFLTQLRLEAVWRGATGRLSKKDLEQAAAETYDPVPPAISTEPLRASVVPMGYLAGALHVAKFEFKELILSPGLYLFIPIILVQILGTALTEVGAFGVPILLTSGSLAVGTMNTITLCTCLLLLFYTVESLSRDKATGFGEIFHATPVATGALLFGKSLANVFVGAVILIASFIGCWAALLVQGRVPMNPMPFAVSWIVLLVPTFLVWTAFVLALYSMVRNRYMTYALALGALIFTGYRQTAGKMNWVGNWDLWSAVRWSDFGVFELNRAGLLWNRLFVVLLTVLFVAIAIRFFGRRQTDPTRFMHRLSPRELFRSIRPLLPILAACLALGVFLYTRVEAGYQGEAAEKARKDYWKANIATFKDVPLPAISYADLDVELLPRERRLISKGSFDFYNHTSEPMRRFPLTTGRHWENLAWTMDGEAYEPRERANLYVIEPDQGLSPGEHVIIGWTFDGGYPKGLSKNGGGADTFVLPMGVVLTGFEPSFAPVLGYDESVGVDKDNASDPRTYFDTDFHEGITRTAFGSPTAFRVRTRITAPEAYALNGVGTMVSDSVTDGKRTVLWETDHPVKLFNIVAGRWNVRRGEGTAIYYLADHVYNIDEMIEALDAARKWFSEWFYPYPWDLLKVSEFGNLATYAQGFATNITFSEGIGFLTKSDPRANAAFMVTAHESAHQWWGNILTPGKGPGGGILSEGMAHFSTALLFEQVKGPRQRMEFMRTIEERYGERRQRDSERPLVMIDGEKPGDTTVTYDKGGWVFWMLLHTMGRDAALAGLREFIDSYHLGPDHALIQDLVRVMRKHAPDAAVYDAFVRQWMYEVHVPQYKLNHVQKKELDDGRWEVTFRVENIGDGDAPLCLAASSGDRFPDEDKADAKPYRETRVTLHSVTGEETGKIVCSFNPSELVVDPDVMVLQLKRDQAIHRF